MVTLLLKLSRNIVRVSCRRFHRERGTIAGSIGCPTDNHRGCWKSGDVSGTNSGRKGLTNRAERIQALCQRRPDITTVFSQGINDPLPEIHCGSKIESLDVTGRRKLCAIIRLWEFQTG